MLVALVAVWAGTAQADLETRVVKLCMNYDIEFTDNGHEDYWADNSVDRWARGLKVTVWDEVQSQTLYLNDSTGCAWVVVEVPTFPQSNIVWWVESEAQVNGGIIKVHRGTWDRNHDWDVQPVHHQVFTAHASHGATITRTILTTDMEWQTLAVASWITHRNWFHVLQPPDRACCLESAPGYAPDGTCAVSDYGQTPGPIHYFVDTDGACGGGNSVQSSSTTDWHMNAVHFGTCRSKWLVAHETGHMLVGMRMTESPYPDVGQRHEQYNNQNAPLDDCAGWLKKTAGNPPVPQNQRGMLNKEYAALALREGWGEFFAIWAWNNRFETNCQKLYTGKWADIDLDGVPDNDFPPLDTADPTDTGFIDGTMDCWGTPYAGNLDPLPAPTDGVNWLEDLEYFDDDDVDGLQCSRVAGTYGPPRGSPERNRATMWDVVRFFWDLTSVKNPDPADPYDGDPIAPQWLSDLYVDTCPRGWSQDDNEWTVGSGGENIDTLPLERLRLSAAAHPAIQARVDAELDDHLLH